MGRNAEGGWGDIDTSGERDLQSWTVRACVGYTVRAVSGECGVKLMWIWAVADERYEGIRFVWVGGPVDFRAVLTNGSDVYRGVRPPASVKVEYGAALLHAPESRLHTPRRRARAHSHTLCCAVSLSSWTCASTDGSRPVAATLPFIALPIGSADEARGGLRCSRQHSGRESLVLRHAHFASSWMPSPCVIDRGRATDADANVGMELALV